MKATELATVGVALHVDGHRVEVHRRQEDQTGTGAEDGKAGADILTDGLEQTELVQELGLGG